MIMHTFKFRIYYESNFQFGEYEFEIRFVKKCSDTLLIGDTTIFKFSEGSLSFHMLSIRGGRASNIMEDAF